MAATAISSVHSHFTPTCFPCFLLLLPLLLSPTTTAPILAVNVSSILSSFPDLSDFNSLISSTAVSSDLADRSALTILAVPNSYLRSSFSASATTLADVLRYHVLLNYLTWSDLRQTPPSGTLFATLYQTTGRATSNFGALNVTFNPSDGVVSIRPPSSSNGPNNNFSAVVLSLVKAIPYSLSIFTVSSLLTPYGFDLMSSDTLPSPPLRNITRALIDGHDFNVAASMLSASGVVDEFEADEGGAGITLFIPTDEAFADLPSSVQLQALPADRKALVLKFHVLHSYYPLGSLESIVNPVQPTLATEDSGAGSFTLNISRVNGSVALNSGVAMAVVTQTVFDQNPVAIFGISRVLLPREIFGGVRNKKGRGAGVAQPPEEEETTEVGTAPESSPERFVPPSNLESSSSAAGGLRDESGGCGVVQSFAVILFMLSLYNRECVFDAGILWGSVAGFVDSGCS